MPENKRTMAAGDSGVDVASLQARLLDLGHAVAPDELVESMYGASTRAAVMAVQSQAGTWASGAVDSSTAELLDRLPDSGWSFAAGRVTGPDGSAAHGVSVRLFDRDLRSEQELGRAETDDLGYWLVRYSQKSFSRAEKDSADLFVRVVAGRRRLFDPAVRDTLFNAPRLASLSTSLASVRPPKLTELERVEAAARKVLGDLAWTQVSEDAEHSDITFLTGEIGVQRSVVDHVAVAHRLAEGHGGHVAAFYSVLATETLAGPRRWSTFTPRFVIDTSTSIPELFHDIVLLPSQVVRTAVETAVHTFLVPSATLDDLPGFEEMLASHRDAADAHLVNARQDAVLRHLAGALTSDAPAALLDLLRGEPRADLGDVLGRLTDIGALSRSGNDPAIAKLRVAELVGDVPGTLAHLQSVHGIDSPAQLHRLAALSPTDWQGALVATHEAGGAARVPSKAALSRQAQVLSAAMAERFPTTAVATRLAADPRPAVAHARQVADLLAAHPEFDLRSGNSASLVEARDASDGATKEVLASLRTVQRVFTIAPSYEKASALMSGGITSAAQVASMGHTQFTTLAQGSGAFTAAQADAAYHAATAQSTASLLLAGQLASAGSTTQMMVFKKAAKKIEQVTQDFPSMATLFARGDVCECLDCRSVHGAAAYLVDVLQFLKHRLVVDTTATPAVTVKGAKDTLFARRPDLGDLDLSCDNTNIPLPYLDLVCELLEDAVSPDPGVAYAGPVAEGIADPALVALLAAQGWAFGPKSLVYAADLAGAFVVRDADAVAKLSPDGGNWLVRRLHQTSGTAEQVGAAPQFTNADAYATLASASFAFGLPFDLAHEETRAYFAQLDIDRADLMSALQVAGTPSDPQVAGERFGLSDAQRLLVTQPRAAGQQGIWNTPTNPASATLRNVESFVDRAGVDYRDLLVLVDLPWVDGGQDLFVRSLTSSPDLAQKEIVHLDDAALDRIHRFLRFRRACGWDMRLLDRAIGSSAGGGGALDDEFVRRAHVLDALATALRTTKDAVLDLCAPLDPADPAGSYARTFLDISSVGQVDSAFTPAGLAATEAAETAVAGSGTKLSAHLDFLTRALGVAVADGPTVVSLVGGDPAATTAQVSRAYAVTRLARLLGLTLAQLEDLVTIVGTDPLASLDALTSFTGLAGTVRASGLDGTTLRYLLRHDSDDALSREIPDASVTAFITALHAAYGTAKSSTASAYSPAATTAENAVAVAREVGGLAGVPADALATLMTLLTDSWTDPTLTEAAFVDAVLGPIVDTTAIKAAIATRNAAARPRDAQANAVIGAVAAATAAHLYLLQRTDALEAALAAALHVPRERVQVLLDHGHLKAPSSAGSPLLRDTLLDDTTTAGTLDLQGRALRLLTVMVTAITSSAVDDATLGWVLHHAAALGWLELDALPYDTVAPDQPLADWLQLHRFTELVAELPAVEDPAQPGTPHTVTRLFDTVLAAASTSADVLDELAALAGVPVDVLSDLDSLLGLSAADLTPYQDPAVSDRLVTTAGLLRRLGLDVATAVTMVGPSLSLADALTMRGALKSKYADAQWLGVLKQVQDDLREQKRDALVSYLLATNADLVDSTDLYDWFLIDVDMASCMPTSRIVQAHATVQLFAMRCLMGLEPTSVASVGTDDGWKQWAWMANFRVWEANRKIFLWPENWYAPDLRSDKTELFVALDDQLQQGALTDVAVEDAAIAYVEKLGDIAHLDVMATYYETPKKTMHVFARTKGGDPVVYYHREFQQERYWTPWVRVPLDITGDTLLAFDRNGRVTLAWPVFTAQPKTDGAAPVIPDPASLSGSGKSTDKPQSRWIIKLAVSERAQGTWRPKKVSQGFLTTDYDTDLAAAEQFNFFVWGLGASQSVTCLGPHGLEGSFALTGCKGYPEPTDGGWMPGFLYPRYRDTKLLANRFREMGKDSSDDLATLDVLTPQWQQILLRTPGTFTVTHPMETSTLDWILLALEAWGITGQQSYVTERRAGMPLGTLMPWFYGDFTRSYVVVPGFYPREDTIARVGGGSTILPSTKKTFSDIDQLVGDLLALLEKYAAILNAVPAPPLQGVITRFLADPETLRIWAEIQVYLQLRYGLRFENFYHPLVCLLRTTLDNSGIPGIMNRQLQMTDTGFDFEKTYGPTDVVVTPYPREDFDFTLSGAYSAYNWELFFQLPFDVAQRLNRDQQFGAARDWFHHVFDPVGAADAPVPNRYWKTKPFFQEQPADYLDQLIATIMGDIAADPSGASITDLAFAVSQWRDKPFKPDVVARSRPVAYQISIVVNYVQNLVDWGDSLFRQFTRESVTQATQLYVLAEKLMRSRTRIVPPMVEPPPMTFNQLEADIDLFGNAQLDLETLVPDVSVLPHGGAELPPPSATLTSLYFCIPPNENLMQLHDLIDDRLWKIRNCRDIDGVEAALALFAPPIDPGALVRAAAAGLDASAVVAGLGAPLPHYRFQVMVAKASDLAGQVGALGGSLLAALEKRDGEALARLRSDHEVSVLQAMRDVKVAGLAEAQGAIDALTRSKAVTQARRDHFARQEFMNSWETTATVLNTVSFAGEIGVGLAQILASGLKLVPDFNIGASGFGGSPTATVKTGGASFGAAAEIAAQAIGSLNRVADKGAGLANTQGSYQRRSDDWAFQVASADLELQQIDVQLANAHLHVDTLTRELRSHDLQISNSAAVREAMHSKYTNQELYDWMVGKVSSVYYSAYKLAFDVAKKAERCFAYELGGDVDYISYGYWDSLKKGLMAHEALYADIKRMESAYLDRNKRHYELTKHISLVDIDPAALIGLRATGKTAITLPETLFDIDHPGHFARRIKSVALTLVCSAGPYSTVAATLSLTSNKYRISTAAKQGAATDKDKYAEQPGSDPRFAYNVGSMASVATSTAVSDTGLFELSFHDERYLPFEGAGVASTWQLELPTVFQQVDRATISNVVMTVQYEAQEGGSVFRDMVEKSLVALSNEMALSHGRTGWYAAFSLRDHFPDDWWQLTQTGATQVTLGTQHLPFLVRDHSPTIDAVTWMATVHGKPATYGIGVDGTPTSLNRDPSMPTLCVGTTAAMTLGTPVALTADAAKLQDLSILVHYTVSPT